MVNQPMQPKNFISRYINNFISLYLTPKMLTIIGLGIASGIPISLTAFTLSTRLTEVGITTETIGLFASVGIPYSIKFLWAPIIDYFPAPLFSKFFQRRSAWIVLIQTLLIIVIILLGFLDPVDHIYLTYLLTILLAFLSASQDIVIDAYRIEMFEPEKQGAASANAIAGYRIGMLASGAGAVMLSEYFSWEIVYIFCALGLLIGFFTILLSGEPKFNNEAKISPYEHNLGAEFKITQMLNDSFVNPLKELINKENWVIILLFILLYKLGDAMAASLTSNFLLKEIGFSKLELATIVKSIGFLSTLIGSFIGGWIVYRAGLLQALVICGILQMLSNLMFAAQAIIGYDVQFLTLTIIAENISGGMGSAAMVAYITSLCNINYSATHYAILSSIATVGRTVLSTPSGYIVSFIGWVPFFIFTTLISIPGIILVYYLKYKQRNNFKTINQDIN